MEAEIAASWDPRILQGVLTFSAAAVASATALLIAFVAYPWQKQRDREMEIHREQRLAYSTFFAAFDDFGARLMKDDTDGAVGTILVMRRSLNELALSGGGDGAAACLLAFGCLTDWLVAYQDDAPEAEQLNLRETAKKSKVGAMLIARISLLGASHKDLSELLEATSSDESKGKS